MNMSEIKQFDGMEELSLEEVDQVSGAALHPVVVVGAYVAGGLLGVAAVGVVVGLGYAYYVTHYA